MVLPQTSTYMHFVWVLWFFQVSVLGEKNPFTTLPEQFFLPLWSHLVHNKFMLWQAVLSIAISLSFIVKKKKKSKSGTILNLVLALTLVTHAAGVIGHVLWSPWFLHLFPVGIRVWLGGKYVTETHSLSLNKLFPCFWLISFCFFCFGDGYWTKNCQIFLDPCIFAHRWYLKYGSTP